MAQNSGQGSLFESYEASYCAAATSVSNSLVTLSTLQLEQRQAKSKQLDKEIRDAEQILQRLDMEARSFSTEQSRPYLQKIKEYRADLKKLKEDVKKAATSGGAGGLARAELGLADDYYQTSAGQRERLLTATERLGKTSDRIQQGRQQLLETEATGAAILEDLQRQRQAIERSRQAELGISVLSDLQRQRESILHSRDTLGTVDANIGKAREILAVMSRRIIQNKVIMWGVIALLAGAIGLVIWAKIS